MQKCLSARLEDASEGGEISSRSNFYQPPPPRNPLPRIQHSPEQARFPLTDESRYSTLFQSSLTNLCFELDLANVWECLGAAVQMGFTYAASVTFQAYRDVQKPHLSLSHCFHLGKTEDRKKTTEDMPALQKFEINQVY